MLWCWLICPVLWLWDITAPLRDRLDLACVSVRLALLDRDLETLPRGAVRDAAVTRRFALHRHRLAIRRTIAGRQARWEPTAPNHPVPVTAPVIGGFPYGRS